MYLFANGGRSFKIVKILIVDDHPMFMDGLIQGLHGLDDSLDLDQAATAEQALARIDSGIAPDFMLIDIFLPGESGIVLLKTLIAREIWIPALVLSASDDPLLIREAIDNGAMGYVPKTFSARQLLEAMKIVTRGDLFLPPGITRPADSPAPRDSNGDSDRPANRHGITRRQTEVLKLMTRGYSNRKIASTLFVSEHTVKSHIKAMFKALRVANRTACVRKAGQLGLVQPSPKFFD